jgi:ribonucleoside-diphosphate reductase alpha chain
MADKARSKTPSGTDGQPPDLGRPIELTDNAHTVLTRRYLRKGPDGKPAESVAEMFWRVAGYVAGSEDAFSSDVKEVAIRFYELLTAKCFLPNSPTFTGAGTPLGQLAACFVLGISDDMGREPDGIFQTLRDAALIQQTGGGNGFSFSRLRPRGARVYSSGGTATGPIGFLRVYDQAFDEVAQGGVRRGANIAVLRVDHPDIREFITCKTSEDKITNFNVSVGVSDKFMRAVEDDADFDLINPQDGQVWETVRARELFDLVVRQAHHNGEPGVLFLDAANRSNPVPHLGEYEATNPCVAGDTWVTTDKGPVRVENAVGRFAHLLLNGQFYATSREGFFPTGKRDVLEIRTRRGLGITLTPNHPVRVVTRLTRHVVESEWRNAGDLIVGGRVILSNNREASWEGQGTWEEGYLLGLLVGDGTITNGKAVISVWGKGPGPVSVRREVERIAADLPHRVDFQGFVHIPDRGETRLTLKALYDLARSYGLSEEFKGVSPQIEQTSSAFHQGFLRGLFDTDGAVIGSQSKGISVRLAQSNLALLEAVQRMLHRLGIFATLYKGRRPAGTSLLPDGKGGLREYPTKAQHELVISGENLAYFASHVGFSDEEKASRLDGRLRAYRRKLNRERFVDEIVSIEPRGRVRVYDAHVPGVHAFNANGFYVHNCGEQFLLSYENCCLGSINLAQHVTDDGRLDWPKLQESVELATRFLDDVVEANAYVDAVPQLKEAAHRTRRIGLGIMGLGDMMYRLGIRYGSEEAQEFAGQVMEFIRYHCMLTSVQLAQERGPFPTIEGSIYDPKDLKWTPPRPLFPYSRDWGRPALNWGQIVDGIKAHGIRNAAQTTVAPTGTIATVAGCEAYGCEPVFALAYVRHFNDEGRDVQLQYASPLFERALVEAGLSEEERRSIIEKVNLTGSCQDIEEVPAHIRRTFVVSSDVSPEEHVRMQATLQAFVDSGVSKTVNCPASTAEADVAKVYQLAWKLGCKGITVYVTGSREKVVLETQATAQAKESDQPLAEPLPMFNEEKKPRPRALPGYTYRVRTPLGTAYVTVNENGDRQPFEVFMHTSKAGSETAAVSEALGRLISYILRLASPVSPRNRLREVVRQLEGIGGGRSLGLGPNRVRSLPDGVAQVLAEHLERTDEAEQPTPEDAPAGPTPGQMGLPIGDLCPECGEAALVSDEGCRRCYACGYSDC